MHTDAAVLAKEAGNFDRISGELTSIITQVDATAGALSTAFSGPAGAAAQAAIVRFTEAGNAQIKELTDISQNIHGSGVDYTATDDDQMSALQHTVSNMGHGL